jgi:universal stress protein A
MPGVAECFQASRATWNGADDARETLPTCEPCAASASERKDCVRAPGLERKGASSNLEYHWHGSCFARSMTAFRKILVPVDFSPHSEEALRVAGEIARRYGGTLDIVHVYDPVVYPLPDGYVMLTQRQLDELFAVFDKQLSLMETRAEAAGVGHVETHVRQGIAAADICDFAAQGAFDLIVMGTHGRRGLSHLLLGSVAERVLRLATCPVLTLKASIT